MDTLSHFVLGGSLAVAALGHRAPVVRAALWGGVAANLPDLDVLIDHGEPIRNLLMHRADSHSLLYLLMASPLLGWLGAWAQKAPQWRARWTLAMGLALLSHPMLDLFTVYGTQLLIPFNRVPWSTASVFIIDPLVTLPLLWCVVLAWRRQNPARVWPGLVWCVAYLGWSLGAQAHVLAHTQATLDRLHQPHSRILVTPTAFNTLLWRAVVITPDGRYLEGFHSLLAPQASVAFTEHRLGDVLPADVTQWDTVRDLRHFSRGFLSLQAQAVDRPGQLVATDLRMGQEGSYFFRFVLGHAPAADAPPGAGWVPVTAERLTPRLDVAGGLAWLSRRLFDPQAEARR